MSLPPFLLSAIWLLAEGAEGAAKGGDAGQGGGPPGLGSMLLPLAMIFVLFYFIILRPEKRKAADHRSLLESIKKNDRVVTIGGIYGVVMNVQKESDRVTLKIDESNNTKIDVTVNAIARVMAADTESEKK
jgi:preprotein translocase subunit YajC